MEDPVGQPIKNIKIQLKKDNPAPKRLKADNKSPPDSSKLHLLEDDKLDRIMAKLDALQPFMEKTTKKLDAMEATLTKMDNRFQEAEHRIDQLETTTDGIHELRQRISLLEKECELNNNRSRSNNLRIYGIPEGIEQGDLCEFFAGFLKSLLKLKIDLDLQDAHRLGPKSINTDPKKSRGVIVHLLKRRQVQLIVQTVKQTKDLSWNGHRIFINQDLSKVSADKKKEFLNLRPTFKKLNIQYGFIYPSTFKLTYNSVTKIYDNIEDIRQFLYNITSDEMETLPSLPSISKKATKVFVK